MKWNSITGTLCVLRKGLWWLWASVSHLWREGMDLSISGVGGWAAAPCLCFWITATELLLPGRHQHLSTKHRASSATSVQALLIVNAFLIEEDLAYLIVVIKKCFPSDKQKWGKGIHRQKPEWLQGGYSGGLTATGQADWGGGRLEAVCRALMLRQGLPQPVMCCSRKRIPVRFEQHCLTAKICLLGTPL